ncbi:MAG: DUF4870 domain-containing protein [bacterium]
MYPSKIERSWGAAPQWISAVVHFCTGGVFTWAAGMITHWLWKDRSRFVAFHSLQASYLGFVVLAVGGIAWLLHGLPLIGVLLTIVAGLTWLFSMGLLVVGALAAGRGEAFQYPIVGAIARRKVGL